MMKRIKIASILLLVISVLIFGAYKIYEKMTSDTVAPVIKCGSEEILVSVSASEEEFLSDVTAIDDKSGDVSETLVVEEISAFAEENTRIVTYAAIDEKGNVGRHNRILKYTDYQIPKFNLTNSLRFPKGRMVNVLENMEVYSVLDGDLTDSIKYSVENTINLENTGVYSIEFRVMDSAGHIEYLNTEIEIYDITEERIQVFLSEYLIYLPKGAQFDPQAYYVGADTEGTLAIQSDVNTSEAGVYSVDYVVQGVSSIGKNRLIVVVTES